MVTDTFAVTLAQTLVEGVHVGVALKAVRGRAAYGAFTWPGDVSHCDRLLDVVEDG